jgi:hypothetical protein
LRRSSGDIGYYDDSERFFIVDRVKTMMKVYGFQVWDIWNNLSLVHMSNYLVLICVNHLLSVWSPKSNGVNIDRSTDTALTHATTVSLGEIVIAICPDSGDANRARGHPPYASVCIRCGCRFD